MSQIFIIFFSFLFQNNEIFRNVITDSTKVLDETNKAGNGLENGDGLDLNYLYCTCEDFARMPSRDSDKRGNPGLNNILLGYVWEGDALNLVGYSNKSNDSKMDDYDMNLKLFFKRHELSLFQIDKNYFLGSYILKNKMLHKIKGLCGVRSPKTNEAYGFINLMPVIIKGTNGNPSYIQWKIFISSKLPVDPRNANRNFSPMHELYLGEEVEGGLLNPIPPGGGSFH